MVDGLFISVVGMAAVFVILTIMMLLMTGLERIFRGEEVDEDAVAKRGGDKQEEMSEMTAIALAVILHRKNGKLQPEAKSVLLITSESVIKPDQSREKVRQKELLPVRASTMVAGRSRKKMLSPFISMLSEQCYWNRRSLITRNEPSKSGS